MRLLRQPLFSSETKFESGTGWPVSGSRLAEDVVVADTDQSSAWFEQARCSRCNAHLGHVFEDGPAPHWTALLHEFGATGLKPKPQEESKKRNDEK